MEALKRSVDGGFVKNGGPQNSPQRLEKSHISEKSAQDEHDFNGRFLAESLAA